MDRTLGVRTSRRHVMRGAGIGFTALWWASRRSVAAQNGEATPVARGGETDDLALSLPPGIRLVDGDGEQTDAPPAAGGSLRIVRPESNVANFNPSAFAQDPQIPL